VLYEIVDGRYEELPPMSAYAIVLANLLSFASFFALPRGLGVAVCEGLFGLTPTSRCKYRPDVAVSHERWPKDRPWPDTDPWPVVRRLRSKSSALPIRASTMQKVKGYLEGA
jgi:hypothetical protein